MVHTFLWPHMFPQKGIKAFGLVYFEAALLQNGPSGKAGVALI